MITGLSKLIEPVRQAEHVTRMRKLIGLAVVFLAKETEIVDHSIAEMDNVNATLEIGGFVFVFFLYFGLFVFQENGGGKVIKREISYDQSDKDDFDTILAEERVVISHLNKVKAISDYPKSYQYICKTMTTILLAISIMGIAFAGFAVRLFFIKDSSVHGGCAGKNPLLAKEGVACGVCGQIPATEGCGEEN